MKPAVALFLFSVFFLPLRAQRSAKIRAEIAVLENRLAQPDPKPDGLLAELENLRLQRNLCELRETGLPFLADSGTTYFHSGYAFNYNEPAEQANWVAHIISPEIVGGTVTRSNDFRPDPLVKTGSAGKADYSQSGYDRGHLAPSADFNWSAKALSESFFYSNMAPQHPQLNRERWAALEEQLREYVRQYGRPLHVVTGPVWDEGLDSIGPNRVAVPKRFYKVAIDYSARPMQAIGFVMPNTPCKYPVMYYAVPVDSVERLTHIDFFPRTKKSLQNTAEKAYTDSLWRPDKEKGNVAPMRAEQLPAGAVNSVDAKEKEGQSANVCGTVVATRYDEKTGTTLLDFDQKSPRLFYLSIRKEDLPHFSYAPELILPGKRVCATGTVNLIKGTPTLRPESEKAVEILK